VRQGGLHLLEVPGHHGLLLDIVARCMRRWATWRRTSQCPAGEAAQQTGGCVLCVLPDKTLAQHMLGSGSVLA
jgi:hypothetical protein